MSASVPTPINTTQDNSTTTTNAPIFSPSSTSFPMSTSSLLTTIGSITPTSYLPSIPRSIHTPSAMSSSSVVRPFSHYPALPSTLFSSSSAASTSSSSSPSLSSSPPAPLSTLSPTQAVVSAASSLAQLLPTSSTTHNNQPAHAATNNATTTTTTTVKIESAPHDPYSSPLSSPSSSVPASPSSSSAPSQGRGKWTVEEDNKLKEAVALFDGKNWKSIAENAFGSTKSDVQCLHRWQKVLRPGLVKGPWSPEEDAHVLSLVAVHGLKKWSLIASFLNGRLGKQCRERYYNHLNPAIKNQPWTAEEDEFILQCHAELGNKWACFSPSCSFLLPDGSSATALQVYKAAQSTQVMLVAQDGSPTNVMSARHSMHHEDPCQRTRPLYRIDYAHGSHTVTDNHLVSLRVASSPTVSLSNNTNTPSVRVRWVDGASLRVEQRRILFGRLNDARPIPQLSSRYPSVDAAIEAACLWGSSMLKLNGGKYDQGVVYSKPFTASSGKLTYIQCTVSGLNMKTHTRRFSIDSNLIGKNWSPVIPKKVSDADAIEWAYEWLDSQRRAGVASPLDRGDMLDIEARHLQAVLNGPLGKHISLPRLTLPQYHVRDITSDSEIGIPLPALEVFKQSNLQAPSPTSSMVIDEAGADIPLDEADDDDDEEEADDDQPMEAVEDDTPVDDDDPTVFTSFEGETSVDLPAEERAGGVSYQWGIRVQPPQHVLVQHAVPLANKEQDAADRAEKRKDVPACVIPEKYLGRQVCYEYSRLVHMVRGQESTRFQFPSMKEVLQSERSVNVHTVYMLHNQQTAESMLNKKNQVAATMRNLVTSWCQLGLSAQEVGAVMITELNPLAADIGEAESECSDFDEICEATIHAALLLEPHNIIVFGAPARDRWSSTVQNVTGVHSVKVHYDGNGQKRMSVVFQADEHSAVVIVNVHFTADPSSGWCNTTQVIAQVHNKQWDASKFREHEIIKQVVPAGDGEYVAIEVEDVNKRCVLADHIIAHNCIASRMNGRTDNAIKNRWNSKLKFKAMHATSSPLPAAPSTPPRTHHTDEEAAALSMASFLTPQRSTKPRKPYTKRQNSVKNEADNNNTSTAKSSAATTTTTTTTLDALATLTKPASPHSLPRALSHSLLTLATDTPSTNSSSGSDSPTSRTQGQADTASGASSSNTPSSLMVVSPSQQSLPFSPSPSHLSISSSTPQSDLPSPLSSSSLSIPAAAANNNTADIPRPKALRAGSQPSQSSTQSHTRNTLTETPKKRSRTNSELKVLNEDEDDDSDDVDAKISPPSSSPTHRYNGHGLLSVGTGSPLTLLSHSFGTTTLSSPAPSSIAFSAAMIIDEQKKPSNSPLPSPKRRHYDNSTDSEIPTDHPSQIVTVTSVSTHSHMHDGLPPAAPITHSSSRTPGVARSSRTPIRMASLQGLGKGDVHTDNQPILPSLPTHTRTSSRVKEKKTNTASANATSQPSEEEAEIILQMMTTSGANGKI